MFWTGSEKQRRPQQSADCPDRFRGSQRYVSNEECRLPSRMPFGKYKYRPLSEVPESYLRWVLTLPGHDELKLAIQNVLQREKTQ